MSDVEAIIYNTFFIQRRSRASSSSFETWVDTSWFASRNRTRFIRNEYKNIIYRYLIHIANEMHLGTYKKIFYFILFLFQRIFSFLLSFFILFHSHSISSFCLCSYSLIIPHFSSSLNI